MWEVGRVAHDEAKHHDEEGQNGMGVKTVASYDLNDGDDDVGGGDGVNLLHLPHHSFFPVVSRSLG